MIHLKIWIYHLLNVQFLLSIHLAFYFLIFELKSSFSRLSYGKPKRYLILTIKNNNKARLKNMLICRHPGLFFRVHPADREKKLWFWDGKDSINPYLWYICDYKFFFQEWTSKRFFDPHVSYRPGRVTTNQHIFKSGLTF